MVVSRYLQRDLFPALRAACAPGGVVLYETFTTRSARSAPARSRPITCSSPASCAARFDGFEVLFYEEVSAPEAVARIAARRRT